MSEHDVTGHCDYEVCGDVPRAPLKVTVTDGDGLDCLSGVYIKIGAEDLAAAEFLLRSAFATMEAWIKGGVGVPAKVQAAHALASSLVDAARKATAASGKQSRRPWREVPLEDITDAT